ncbi:MAG: type II toxin-antitoxin system VapC family toxin [Bifidobacteriaceae bacterium]|jgi:predicted nucleic acid-binding protein|nr:type II toxin-antitoxin system VapC family toxin [Bifidobacteriaceae bacterium]
MTVVLDASAAVEILLSTGRAAGARGALAAAGGRIHAPDHMALEVVSAVRRLARRGALTEARAEGALEDLAAIDVEYWPALPLVGGIWLARANITPFDAAYVVLAEALGATLVTTDQPLARAVARRSSAAVALVA